MTIRPLRPTLFLDLDNTLLECGAYYLSAKADAASLIAARTKLSEKNIAAMIDAIDLVAIGGPNGFNRNRFPESFAVAAVVASSLCGHADIALSNQSYEIASRVFTAEYALYPGVIETLRALRAAGYQLVIATKGDHEVQAYKIDKHDLRAEVDHVFISLTKTTEELIERMAQVDADPENSYVIGDSMKDDIAPAIAAGIKSIFVNPGTNADWQKSFGVSAQATHDVGSFPEARHILVPGVASVATSVEAA